MINSAYLGKVVCSDIFTFISASKIFRQLFMIALPHGTSVVLAFIIVHKVPLCYRYGIFAYCVVGDVGYGWLLMASVVFFGVIGIGLVFGFTLRSGVDFSGELILWFLCGAVLSVSILGAPPPVFTLVILYALGCSFPSYLGVGSLYFFFWVHLDSLKGGFVAVGGVLMNVLNCGKRLGALFGPLFLTLRYGSVSHHFIYLFSKKYWPAAGRPHVCHWQFLQLASPVQVFQESSHIGNCVCDGICCWHEGHFGWCGFFLCLLISLPLYLVYKHFMCNSHS